MYYFYKWFLTFDHVSIEILVPATKMWTVARRNDSADEIQSKQLQQQQQQHI
jgi:hypothetical protein